MLNNTINTCQGRFMANKIKAIEYVEVASIFDPEFEQRSQMRELIYIDKMLKIPNVKSLVESGRRLLSVSEVSELGIPDSKIRIAILTDAVVIWELKNSLPDKFRNFFQISEVTVDVDGDIVRIGSNRSQKSKIFVDASGRRWHVERLLKTVEEARKNFAQQPEDEATYRRFVEMALLESAAPDVEMLWRRVLMHVFAASDVSMIKSNA
eukprot:TRINITY_DN1983_c0_g1_i1.p2 TRINITY_DN1983_c0_g1~~TRINITY_DN1983_c0_g1_i1.p2  ORF type:complete len:209 (-),score=70.73 TRINITY_DN1983_c0_g1_i1:11-637(-)